MSDCASYKQMDLVDYFSHSTGVSNAHLLRMAESPKCRAIIDAFVATPMRLGAAVHHLADEFERLLPEVHSLPRPRLGRKKQLHFSCVPLIKQMGRRIELEPTDPRAIIASADLRSQFSEIYHLQPMSDLQFQLWLLDAPFESNTRDLSDIWQTIKRHDGYQYLWYWEISHGETLHNLLCNRRFIAGVHASLQQTEPNAVFGLLDRTFSDQIPGLSAYFRFMLYAHLAGGIAAGLLCVPQGLQAEFSEYYRDEKEF